MLSTLSLLDLTRSFDDILASTWGTPSSFAPPVDISQDDTGYILTFDVPGVAEKDLSIEVKDRILTIRGERINGKKYTYSERHTGRFARSFTLPRNLDGDQISADLANGVLTVRLAKKPEVQPKRIEIRSSGV